MTIQGVDYQIADRTAAVCLRRSPPAEASRRAVIDHYLEELAGVSGIITPEDLLAGMEAR